ncbi:MAG: S8 family serine peptidase [Desulfatitalea sp.]|nr:S8 family serine peptidase [Desulfatitalea sp.]NNK02811.1 S8 family serine peptidase [Desulfatitalea sp.]
MRSFTFRLATVLVGGFLLLNGCSGCSSDSSDSSESGGFTGSGGSNDSEDSDDSYEPSVFTISGTILGAAGNRLDADTNDAALAHQTNNNFNFAQSFRAPFVLGGFVKYLEDSCDLYATSLNKGDVVQLILPDDKADDTLVTLDLYAASRDIVGTIDSVTSSSVLAIPTAGDYFIEVQAKQGATAYQLIVGAPWTMATESGVNLKASFVSGEVLVRFKTHRQTHKVAPLGNLISHSGLREAGRGDNGWVRLRSDDLGGSLRRLNRPSILSRLSQGASGYEQRRAARQDTMQLLETLRAHPDVAHATLNYIRKPLFTPNDTLYPQQWHLDLIQLPAAWDVTQGSREVIVAVLDTGILSAHPDLKDKLVPGYDFVSDMENAGDGDGFDDDPEDAGDDSDGGSFFHGTHVAGTVAAAFNNGIGVAGVGGRTRIMPVRVIGRLGGIDSDIAFAIRWAAGLPVTNQYGYPIPPPEQRADIINMSFGGPGDPGPESPMGEAVAAARKAGVILIAAAGNSGQCINFTNYPAGLEEVVSVSSVDANANLAPYSSFGRTIDVAAPGGNFYRDVQPDSYGDGVLSTSGEDVGGQIEGRYSYYQGTSMAAPHVSGVAALMKAVKPEMTPDEFSAALENGLITSDLGAEGRDDLFGHGLIDAYQAVVIADGDLIAPEYLSVTPHSLRLDHQTNAALLFLRRSPQGSGLQPLSVTVQPDRFNDAWLSISPTFVGVDTARYTIFVQRHQLSGGLHCQRVTVSAATSTVTVPVTVEVLPDPAASAAIQYLLLREYYAPYKLALDPIPLWPVNGSYTFRLEGIPKGSYILMASSDIDGDLRLLEKGEAVGGYPSLGEMQPIDLYYDIGGIQFVTGFSLASSLQPEDAISIAQEGM